MIELSPQEKERQTAILRPVRQRQHLELGYSGLAEIIATAPTAINAPNTHTTFSEGSLLYVFRHALGQLSVEKYMKLGERDSAVLRVLTEARKVSSNIHLLGMGHCEMLGTEGFRRITYFAGVQFSDTGSETGQPKVLPFEGLQPEDITRVSQLVGEIALLKAAHNLSCLNDDLVNDSIPVRGVPLP